MKKKLILLTALLLMCCPIVTACGSGGDGATSNPVAQTGTDLDKSINSVYDMALDKEVYSFSNDVYINVDEKNNLIDYTIIVENDTTTEQALQYATDLIKALNDSYAEQDDTIAKSSDDSYGGLFDKYNLLMTVATEESVLTEKDWLICQRVEAGEHTPMKTGGFNNSNE